MSERGATVAAAGGGGLLAVRISILCLAFGWVLCFDQVFPQGGHVAPALQLLHT